MSALMVSDAAVVVCEPNLERAMSIMPILRFLDEFSIPHILYINKIDTGDARMRDVIEVFQGCSSRPLVLRQVPLRDGDTVTGFIDLVSERAYQYNPDQPVASGSAAGFHARARSRSPAGDAGKSGGFR